ncbi:hypothetical protein H0H81_011937 [Sphagnurus paluster]|uniref:RING-type domain-containing protein n=1 Tax=Sphagnurus paluster TaxID=117069 RepID=A0A9P7K4W4_9AGAR|nr:hypothetical protein H0H81_011937 [Sphagnurus paluster]
MASLRSQEAIEISSSPEPDPKPKQTRIRCTKPSANIPVFELTDSDNDRDTSMRFRSPGSLKPTAGPSSRPKVGGSRSMENIQTQHRKVKATSSKDPLFLSSDEENNPIIDHSMPGKAHEEFQLPIHVDMPEMLRDETRLVEPDPELVPDDDPESTAVARILEIIPDVEPDHLLALVTNYFIEHPNQGLEVVVEQILHALFEDPKYPKVDRKGKGKRKQTVAEAEEVQALDIPAKKPKIDYADKSRPFKGGVHYIDLALECLQTAFPYIPKAYLRTTLAKHKCLYAPTHLFLLDQEKNHQRQRDANERVNLPYNKRVTPFRPKGKGTALSDDELEAERKWLSDKLQGNDAGEANVDTSDDTDDGECEDGIECGCCFSKFRFVSTPMEYFITILTYAVQEKLVQCPETHLFCSPCMKSYAETLLGSHNPNIKCMDQSGCTALISTSELQRFLPPKLMELYERVKQRKELDSAGLEGLEECPFCDWAVVIENPDEKLLRFELHASSNFIPFSKTIKNPAGQPAPSNSAGKCLLWDQVEQRHAAEVKAAAERALEEYKRANPDVDEKDIKVDIPAAPAPPENPYAVQQRNAEAALQAAIAAHARLQAEERVHAAQMYEMDIQVQELTRNLVRQPHMRHVYAPRIQEISTARGHHQVRGYQMRIEVQQAQQRVDQARALAVAYQRQAQLPAAPPALAWNVNVNVNMYGPPPIAALPARAPPRRARAARHRR